MDDEQEPRTADLVQMIDVGGKPISRRRAKASVRVRTSSRVKEAVLKGAVPKGNVLALAKTAGILAAKRCGDLLPLCHPLPLDQVVIEAAWEERDLLLTCIVRTQARTGVEMEALTGAAVAALTVYDACKSLGDEIVIDDLRLVEKRKEPPPPVTRSRNPTSDDTPDASL